MRNAILSLCLFLFTTTIKADQTNINFGDQLYDFHWSTNKDELFFNMQLPPGMVFSSTYNYSFSKDNLECVVTCTPTSGNEFFVNGGKKAPQGYFLKELKITVSAKNGENKQIDFKIINTALYTLGKTSKNEIVSTTLNGKLKTSTLNMRKPPEFFFTKEEMDAGAVAFKYLVPFVP